MDTTTRRNLLAGLAALPAAFGRKLLGLLAVRPAAAGPAPQATAPGRLRVNPPSESVMRRG